MTIYAGTSGFQYDFWRGSFYPDDLPTESMLAYYSRVFSAVELNSTFYRMPKTEVVERWAESTPKRFRFVVKASRRITHEARIEGEPCRSSVEYLWSKLERFGSRLGAVLFQLPPTLECDLDRLRAFFAMIPTDPAVRVALEFRHASWFCEPVYEALREANVCLCIGDYEGAGVVPDGQTPWVVTTSWGMIRLRDEAYTPEALQSWADRITATWSDAFLFFKHEENGPDLVTAFRECCSG